VLTHETKFKHLVMFCQPPPFDKTELHDEAFVFAICNSGDSRSLCCQLLPCDVIVMTAEHARSEYARFCPGLRLRQQTPLLVVLADERTAVPEYLSPQAVVPERVTATELMAALRNLLPALT